MNIDTLNYKRETPDGLIDERPVTSSTKLILKEAQKHGINIEQIEGAKLFKLKLNNHIEYFNFQVSSKINATTLICSNDKQITKTLLKREGLSVPVGYTITQKDTKELWLKIFNSLKKPLVVKPNIGTQGISVTVDIDNINDYFEAIHKAFRSMIKKEKSVLVEEMLSDFKEYRILASPDKVIGILHREPANVIGDGIKKIRELIKIKNSDKRRGEEKDHPPLFKIKINGELNKYLFKQHKTLEYIPGKNEKVYLRGVSNISQGGDSIDFTDKAHSSVKQIALRAMNSLPSFALGGIDFMTKDITQQQTDSSYAILEINDSPGLDIHDFPYEGKKRNAAYEFLKTMFPEL